MNATVCLYKTHSYMKRAGLWQRTQPCPFQSTLRCLLRFLMALTTAR